MRIGFIGAGKVGFSLGKYFSEQGLQVAGYFSEFNQDAKEAADFTGSRAYETMEQLLEDSEVLFLTVTDAQIENVWNQLKASHISNKIVCHCSGALSSEVFSNIAEYGSYGYSIHPLFAVSDKYNSYKELSNSYFTIEGTPDKLDFIKSLFVKLGNNVCIISKEDKVKYHAAAAVASNLVVGLISMSEKMLRECGFDEISAHEALSPIIKGNVEHIIDDGVCKALTGPIERNDVATVKKHLSVMSSDEKDAYVAVSKLVLEVAKEKNRNQNYKEMEEALR